MKRSRQPDVSIIIASCNHAPFVSDSVGSVLDQDVPGMEVIVVDDGSQDGTPDAVEQIRDPRVTLIRLEENRRFHPRNLALERARGRYIAFQNSDDVWADGKLARQLEIMEGRPDLVACFTAVEPIDVDGRPVSGSWLDDVFTRENRSVPAWLRRFFDHGNCLCLPSALIRASALEKVGGFRPSLTQLADLDLWVRLAAVGELHVIDEPLTRMRVVSGQNLSFPTPEARRRSQIEFVEVLRRYTCDPLLPVLRVAFDDVLAPEARTEATILAGLAHYARVHGNRPAHQIFADRVMAELIDDPAKREEITGLYSAGIVKDFIAARGRLAIDVIDDVAAGEAT